MRPATPLLLSAVVLGACATDDPAGFDQPLPDHVQAAWSAVQPEGLVDLVDDPLAAIPQGLTCPTVEVVDGVETWTGGCALLDGTVIEGSLSLQGGDDVTWVAGDRFAVYRDDRLDLYLDGAIELSGDADLLLLDAAATTCGAHVDCDQGLLTLDLRFTLLPADDALQVYDATVRGFVATEDAEPATVEGAWRYDALSCQVEPLDGIFAVLLDQRHTLVLDGELSCDACAERLVQGEQASAWCADGGT